MISLLLLAGCPTAPEDTQAGDTDTGAEPLEPCDVASGTMCTFAGTGFSALGKDGVPATESHLYLPQDLNFDADGTAYILDWNNHRIRYVDDSGMIYTLAGNGLIGDGPEGPGAYASFNHPTNLEFGPDGNLYLAAWHNSRVEAIDPQTADLWYVAGDGSRSYAGDGGDALVAKLNLPSSVSFASDGTLYVSDQANMRIRAVGSDGLINSVVGDGTAGFTGDGGPASAAEINADKGQQAAPGNRMVIRDDVMYIADTQNQRIRRVILDTMIIDTFAGDGEVGSSGDGGPGTSARFFNPADVAVGVDGEVYVADTENSCVRMITADGTMVSTFAGTCGVPGNEGHNVAADASKIWKPYGVAVDPDGNVYIADTYNQVIRVVYR